MTEETAKFAGDVIVGLNNEHHRVNGMADGIDKDAYKDGLYFAAALIRQAYEAAEDRL